MFDGSAGGLIIEQQTRFLKLCDSPPNLLVNISGVCPFSVFDRSQKATLCSVAFCDPSNAMSVITCVNISFASILDQLRRNCHPLVEF